MLFAIEYALKDYFVLNWVQSVIFIAIIIILASSASFLIAIRFHLNVITARYGEADMYNKHIVIALIINFVNILSFLICHLVLSSPSYSLEVFFIIPVSLHLFHKIFILSYFTWAQCSTIKVFRSSKNLESEKKAKKIASKLRVICLSGVLVLVSGIPFITSFYEIKHMWIAILIANFAKQLTALAEVLSISSKSRCCSKLRDKFCTLFPSPDGNPRSCKKVELCDSPLPTLISADFSTLQKNSTAERTSKFFNGGMPGKLASSKYNTKQSPPDVSIQESDEDEDNYL